MTGREDSFFAELEKKMSALDLREQSISERLKDLPLTWHLWKACILEELGELPAGLEETTREALLEHVTDVKTKLENALIICRDSVAALRSGLAS